jgi:hypothetical protein
MGAFPSVPLILAMALGIAHWMMYELRSEKLFDRVIGDPGMQKSSWNAFFKWKKPIQSISGRALRDMTSAARVRMPWK